MYDFLRKCHLYAALIVLTFLTMYFVSGFLIFHVAWFAGRPRPQPLVRTESLTRYAGPRTPQALAGYLAERFGLHGRLVVPPPAQQPKAALRFSIVHPGTTVRVDLADDADAITLQTTREDLLGILGQLHRVHGYGDGWLFNVFVFFNDVVSASCILFAFTGIYLWWKSTRHHLWGALCLAASCAYTLGMILYLVFAK